MQWQRGKFKVGIYLNLTDNGFISVLKKVAMHRMASVVGNGIIRKYAAHIGGTARMASCAKGYLRVS